MARLAVTVTVIFFLFAFSHARTPSDLPEKDVVSHDSSITLPESDTKAATILLPSEKPDSEPKTVVELEKEAIQDLQFPEPQSVDDLDLNQPFTVVTFRPINRHFPRIRGDRQSPFRVPRPCHHHHHRRYFGGFNGGPRKISYGNDMIIPREEDDRHHHHNGGPSELSFGNDMILPREDDKADQMFHGDEVPKSISYGNDMIISREDDKADQMFHGDEVPKSVSYGDEVVIPREDVKAHPMFHGDEEQKEPARWVRFHDHGRPRFPFRHERWNKEEEMMKRPFFPHHHEHDHDRHEHDHDHHEHEHDHDQHEHEHEHHEHEHEHDHDHHHRHHHHMEDDEVAEEHREGGLNLMSRVRKFLNHF